MQTRLNPYFSFTDTAREALEFYKVVFGGKLDMQTFKEYNVSQDPAEDNKIMHGMLEADNGISFMGADTPNGEDVGTNGSVALSGDNEAELKGYFQKLSVGGTVIMPMEKAPWGDHFGMVMDKFGINWMVNIAGNPSGQ